MLKRVARFTGLIVLGCLLAMGCGRGGTRGGADGFNSATPELKAVWDAAVAADKTNGYVPAVLGYKQILLQRDQLSPNQVKAVEEASSRIFQRLVEASTKGDPAAKQALSQLQPGPPRPKPGPNGP